MKHIVTGTTPPSAPRTTREPSPKSVQPARQSQVETIVDDIDDIQRRFSMVRAVAGSPLRDDLDLCLAELDTLLAALRMRSPMLTYLAFELEEQIRKIVDALQSGYEL